MYKSTLILFACAAAAVAADDTFAKTAAQGGMAEVRLGQLAASKASNAKVKQFGQRMVDDHSKANNELKSLAQKKNMTLPADVASKDNTMYNRLQSMSGDAFDKAYMTAMVKDHQTDIDEFQKEANSGSDSDLKMWASNTLPTLREHLRMAREAADAVGAK